MGFETGASEFVLPGGVRGGKLLTADPTAGAGVAAAVGSFAIRTDSTPPQLWQKTAAGATAWTRVAHLGTKQEWIISQSPGEPTDLVAGAWSADTARQHLRLTVSGAVEVAAPSGTLTPGTPYMLAIVGDGATNPTWVGIYDWGGTAPDFSAVTTGQIAWVSMIVWSATRIHCAANLGIDGTGFAATP